MSQQRLRKKSGIYVQRYEKDDEKIIKEIEYALITLGLSENAAKMLTYLYWFKEAETYDFEAALDLSQPEVSIAMQELKDYGWIKEEDVKQSTGDLPFKIYSLRVSFDEIIRQLEKKHKEAYDDIMVKTSRCKKLTKIK